MRVVLFSFCPSAATYLAAMAAAGTPPVMVVTGRGAGGAQLTSRGAAEHVALERAATLNEPAFVARLAALRPDLLLVAGCPVILGAAILALPRLGALNFHPSLLPDYRGKEPLFWTILRGERRAGVSVHHLTAEVDAGPVLLKRAAPVPPRATSVTLAQTLDAIGAGCVDEILALARSGALPKGEAATSRGSAFPALRAEHGLVDWSRSAVELDRLVRAAAGTIDAFFFARGMRVVLRECHVATGHRAAAPGTVLGVEARSLVLATGDGALAATRFGFVRRAYDGAELASALGLAEGDRLTSNPAF